MRQPDVPDQFKCPNPECGYAIASEGLNRIQLKALKRWGRTCPQCKQFGSFVEQISLFDTQTNQMFDGGTTNANTSEDYLTPDGKRRKSNRKN